MRGVGLSLRGSGGKLVSDLSGNVLLGRMRGLTSLDACDRIATLCLDPY